MLDIIEYTEGMEIKKPCIIRNMPIQVYHKMPALSNSGLKTLIECPAKYYYKYLSGEYEPKEKPHYKIGKAAHCYLLEGEEKFKQIYWHNPYAEFKKDEIVQILCSSFGYDKSIKAASVAELQEILIDNAEIERKEIHLNANELNQVVNMARTAKSDHKAHKALSQEGESELSIFWQDEYTDVWLRCRPDFLPYDCENIPDYKTSDSANPRDFYAKFLSYGYHVQAAMYRMGIKAVTGIDVLNFYFLVQEKEPPYVSQIYNPCDSLILYGEKAVRNGIDKFLECKSKDLWASYSDKVIELSIESPPDDLIGTYDKEKGICYAPKWLDSELLKYEV